MLVCGKVSNSLVKLSFVLRGVEEFAHALRIKPMCAVRARSMFAILNDTRRLLPRPAPRIIPAGGHLVRSRAAKL